MSEFSGKPSSDDEDELIFVVFLVFGLAPFALVKLCGGSWGVFAAGWGVLLLLAGLAWLGWRLWGWGQGWRVDRVLRREETAGLVLVPAVADKAGNEPNHERPGHDA